MTTEQDLVDAGERLRQHETPAPPPIEVVRRHRRRIQARQGIALVVIGLVVALVGVARVQDDATPVDVGVPSTPNASPFEPLRRGAVDIVGTGSFRLVTLPGRVVVTSDESITADAGFPLGGIARRVSHLEVKDGEGRQFRLEVFNDAARAAALLAGRMPATATAVRVGPARDAALMTADGWDTLVWAYDDTRVVAVGSKGADAEVRQRVAGSVIARDRIPPANYVAAAVPNVAGLSYLQAETAVLEAGAKTRWTVESVQPNGGPPTGTVLGSEPPSGTSVNAGDVVSIRVASSLPSEIQSPNGAVVPSRGSFMPWAMQTRFGAPGVAGFSRSEELMDGMFPGTERLNSTYPPPLRFIGGEFVGFATGGAIPLDVLFSSAGDLESIAYGDTPAQASTTPPDPSVDVPAAPSPGSTTVDEGGLRLFVPPDWQIVRSGCPGASKTVYVGPGAGCSRERFTSESWIWVRPLPADPTEIRDLPSRCRIGFVNGMPACQAISGTEEIVFDGLDDMIEISNGTGVAKPEPITSTLQYTPGREPVPSPSAAATAGAYVNALFAQDCASLWDLADDALRAGRDRSRFDADCRASLPGPGKMVGFYSPVEGVFYLTVDVSGVESRMKVTVSQRWSLQRRQAERSVRAVEMYNGPWPVNPLDAGTG